MGTRGALAIRPEPSTQGWCTSEQDRPPWVDLRKCQGGRKLEVRGGCASGVEQWTVAALEWAGVDHWPYLVQPGERGHHSSADSGRGGGAEQRQELSLIHISEPTRRTPISY